MSNPQTAQANANAALLTARFFNFPVENKIESKKAGCPKYDDLEVCEIRVAGGREKVGVFPAHEVFRTDRDLFTGEMSEITYALAYNEQYKQFKSGDAQSLKGTPTSELPFLTASKRLELKALNIHTAEALAALDGHNLKMLGMGGRDLKVQAQTYLDNAFSSADVMRQASLIAAQEARIKQLEARISGAPALEGDASDESLKGPDNADASPFFGMGADDIKNWIQEANNGKRPLGNPSHATLVKMADELNAEIAAKRKSQHAA